MSEVRTRTDKTNPTTGEALLAMLQGGGTASSSNDGNHCIAAGPASEKEQQPKDVKLKGGANGTDAQLGTPSSNTSKSKKQKKKKGNTEGASSSSAKQTTSSGPQASSNPVRDSMPFAWSAFQSSPDPEMLPFPVFDSDNGTDLEEQSERDVVTVPGRDMEHSLKKVLGLH
eukprot:547038_1